MGHNSPTTESRNGYRVPVLETEPATAHAIDPVSTATEPVSQPSNFQPAPAKKLDLETGSEQSDQQVPLAKPPRRGSRRNLVLAALGVGAIAAGSFGYHWWQYASTHVETDNATVAGNVHQISSRLNGTVDAVLVNDNQPVKTGQVLLKLDPRDYQSKVQQAQAALEAARRQASAAQVTIAQAAANAQGETTQAQGDVTGASAGISSAQAAVAAARTGVPAAQAQLAQAEANLQKTQADYNRYASLYQQGAVPRQQLDATKAAFNVDLAQKNAAEQGVQQAQAKLAQAQEEVSSAQAKLASSKGGLQQASATGLQTEVNRKQYEAAQAAIAQAQASLKDAQLQLSYTNITAPSNGRIGRKSVEVGQRVQPGQPLMAIVGSQPWVVANFKETQLEQIRPGERVEVKLDAFPHHPFVGRVDSISPASGAQFALLPPDNATGNFTKIVQRIPVKVLLDPQSMQGYASRLSPGMSAVVSVDLR